MRRAINNINDEVFLLKDFAVLCPSANSLTPQ